MEKVVLYSTIQYFIQCQETFMASPLASNIFQVTLISC